MTRSLLLAGGVLLLAISVRLFPPPPVTAAPDPLAALGRSLGALRVPVVDVLFVRAERLRREGAVEEIPPLYEAVRRLDPDNTAAADFLAATYAFDFLAEAADVPARLTWWDAARRLLEDALVEHPRDPSLHVRLADLLLEIPLRRPELGPGVAERVDDPEMRGLEHLALAAELTGSLPRRGRVHLLRLAVLLPVAAAGRLEDGTSATDALLAMGDEVLVRRREGLRAMRLPTDDPGRPGPPLDEVLAAGLRAVRSVRALLSDPGADAGRRARAVVERLRVDVPEAPVAELLDRIVRAHEGEDG